MKKLLLTVLVCLFTFCAPLAMAKKPSAVAKKLLLSKKPSLEQVAAIPQYQITGVAVAHDGRMFVNFPRWTQVYNVAVGEVLKDGSVKPYPDLPWNQWSQGQDPENRFVSVQSVHVDKSNRLWILDPANAYFQGPVTNGPKLVEVDLATDTVKRVIPFGVEAAPRGSFLNDIRVDTDKDRAYITDAGRGAILRVDLKTGKATRTLENHPSTQADPTVPLLVNGAPLTTSEGKTLQVHADGLALSPDNRYLYYHALTANTLFRIETGILWDDTLSDAEKAAHVETVADTGPIDGMEMDARGNLYLTIFPQSAIKRLTPQGKLETVVQDARLQWPDSFSLGPDHTLYITASQIQGMPLFHHDGDQREPPYRVFRFKLSD